MDTLFNEPEPIARITPAELMELWNAAAHEHGMDGARTLNSTRLRRINKILAEFPSRSYWQDVIERITRSGFCTGRLPGSGGRSWKADFDFLTRHETHLKVLEGKYDDDKFSRLHKAADRGRARIYSDADAPVLAMKRFSGD